MPLNRQFCFSLAFLLGACSEIISSNSVEFEDIHLKNRILTSEEMQTQDFGKHTSGNTYSIVKTSFVQNRLSRDKFEGDYGVKFLERVSSASYIVNLSEVESLSSFLADDAILGIANIQSSDKLSSYLQKNVLTPVEGIETPKTRKILVKFFLDVENGTYEEIIQSALGDVEYTMITIDPLMNGAFIELQAEDIPELTEINEVQWIEPADMEIILDLADAVHSVDAPQVWNNGPTSYDVRGAGRVVGQIELNIPHNHVAFDPRHVSSGIASPTIQNHATMVMGVMIGDGTASSSSNTKGIAYEASGVSYAGGSGTFSQLGNFYSDMETYSGGDVVAVNNSWGATTHALIDDRNSSDAYSSYSALVDKVNSGRDELGNTAFSNPMNVVASAGNNNYQHRYFDLDSSGDFSQSDCLLMEPYFIDPLPGSFTPAASEWTYAGTAGTWRHAVLGSVSILKIPPCQSNSLAGDAFGNATQFSDLTAIIPADLWVYHNPSTSGVIPGTTYFDPQHDAIYKKTTTLPQIDEIQIGDTRVFHPTFSGHFVTVAAGDLDIGSPISPLGSMWGTARVHNASKNTITVGNLAYLSNRHHPSSGTGPSLDGRLLPTLSAPGSESFDPITGTVGIDVPTNTSTYAPRSGTSFSAPFVTGAIAILDEWSNKSRGESLSPAAYRALLVHTADDGYEATIGGNNIQGPDMATGYGEISIEKALDKMPYVIEKSMRVVVDSTDPSNPTYWDIDTAHDDTCFMASPGPLKVTLAWDDLPASSTAGADPDTGFLVHDLNLTLRSPNGTLYYPWSYDINKPIVNSTITSSNVFDESLQDNRNTIEQISIDNAGGGLWCADVYANGPLDGEDQTYALIMDPVMPHGILPLGGTPSAAGGVDLWMKDFFADTGALSATCALPQIDPVDPSPDIWNRQAPDGLLTHEPLVDGITNYNYIRVRNSGSTTAYSGIVSLFESTEGCDQLMETGPVNSNRFRLIGHKNFQKLGANSERIIGPFEWTPPGSGAGHCLYARVESEQDKDKLEQQGAIIFDSDVASEDERTANYYSCRSNNIVVREVGP